MLSRKDFVVVEVIDNEVFTGIQDESFLWGGSWDIKSQGVLVGPIEGKPVH